MLIALMFKFSAMVALFLFMFKATFDMILVIATAAFVKREMKKTAKRKAKAGVTIDG